MNVFNASTLKQIFWKTFFEKLEYCFLVESTKNENATFPYKTTLSKVDVKANRMGTTKWNHHKERSSASNYFNLLKKNFQFKTSYKELIWCTNHSNVHIHNFRKFCNFVGGCFFFVSILNSLTAVNLFLLEFTFKFPIIMFLGFV